MSADVLAVTVKGNNADLVLKCAELRYLEAGVRTLDPTHGLGRFWRRWAPAQLVRHDLDPAKAPDGPADFRRLDYPDASFGAVAFDPPYKLNGAAGSHASDEDYGVAGANTSWQDRHALIREGITEAARVVAPAERIRVDRGRYELRGGIVLIKCQNQVCAGAIRWQAREFADHAATVGLELVDELLLLGHRPQPARTRKHGDCRGTGLITEAGELVECQGCTEGRVDSRQEHAARNYSTLLVTRKAPR